MKFPMDLHITSMAGTWLTVVEGFGGMRILDGKVLLNPLIPSELGKSILSMHGSVVYYFR